MKFLISIHRYSRAFVRPLKTAKGVWAERKGFLIQLEYNGEKAYGEIAPIPEFGTESHSEAEDFLEQIGAVADGASFSVPESLPCCAFAFSAALATLQGSHALDAHRSFDLAGLLPSGVDALQVLARKQAEGYNCFKWKIGVEPFEFEWAIFQDLLAESAPASRFRLDANASLSGQQTIDWLNAIRSLGCKNKIEFFEQPMPVGAESQMADLSDSFGIPIALDESLNGIEGRRWLSPGAWLGPLVLKPCLLGSISLFDNCLGGLASRCVLSSSFETTVGLAQCLKLATRLYASQTSPTLALGFDTQAAFEDPLGLKTASPKLNLEIVERAMHQTIRHAF